jgi:hypothetical protein
MIGSRTISSITLAGMLASLAGGMSAPAYADPQPGTSLKEAGKHFQRGVGLYNEADYRAALVEFRRAYDIAPNAAVLYNIGQAYYQLQNYAAALTTLERYLNESGPAAAHRPEVEQTLATLQARVGRVAITANVADCEITVDDEPVGKTPLQDPVLVSIGRRKITATREGRPPETRYVDVAAGDTVPLALTLAEPIGHSPAAPGVVPPAHESERNPLVTGGWVVTGVLGLGAIGAGTIAYLASRDLKTARESFPVSHADLSSKSSRVSTYSTLADVLGLATLIAGGVTLKLSLSRSHSHEVHVAVAPNGIQLAGAFR